jgi:hypothetical protein
MDTSETTEIKPSFSWRYIALSTLSGLITLGIGGAFGYLISEYTRDKKIIEVLSTSSGNLASLPVGAAGNLEILYPLGDGRKTPIKTLIRYEVKLTNRTEQGADDISVFLEPPNEIQLNSDAEITTDPPELARTISITPTTVIANRDLMFKISLLNPKQGVSLRYFGFSSNEVPTANIPLKVVLSKKDWMQQNAEVAVVSDDHKYTAKDFIGDFVWGLGGMLGLVIASIFIMAWQRYRAERDEAAQAGSEVRRLQESLRKQQSD